MVALQGALLRQKLGKTPTARRSLQWHCLLGHFGSERLTGPSADKVDKEYYIILIIGLTLLEWAEVFHPLGAAV